MEAHGFDFTEVAREAFLRYLSKDLKEVREKAMTGSGERAFHKETANMKTLPSMVNSGS